MPEGMPSLEQNLFGGKPPAFENAGKFPIKLAPEKTRPATTKEARARAEVARAEAELFSPTKIGKPENHDQPPAEAIA